MKQRADLLLVEQGLCESRSKAQALLLAGRIFVGEERIAKAGALLDTTTKLEVRAGDRYVSRGGEKLAGALDDLALDPCDKVCVDVGASTGGFTDCLLQRGARRIYAVDVGRGLLAQRLREDPRVVNLEGTNARYLEPNAFDETIDWVVVDASFIGLEKLTDRFASWLSPGNLLLALIKPQFQVGREEARRARGVIRDPRIREEAIQQTLSAVRGFGFDVVADVDSRLPGPKGNVEHFVHAVRR